MPEETKKPKQPQYIQQAETGLQEAEAEFTRFYKLSLWWVKNREKLKKLAYGLVMAVEGALLLFVLWTFIDSFLISYGKEQRAVAEMVAYGQSDLHAYTLAHAARPLEYSGASVLGAGVGRYDFYASVSNPNPEWWVEITYKFTSSSMETEEQTDFILPGEEKPIIVFAQSSESAPRSASFELLDVKWNRVNRHKVGDYEIWRKERAAFDFRDITVEKDIEVDAKTFSRVSFTVENQGAYSFYDPEFIILLKRGALVVGVNSITLSSLDEGKAEEVVVNWFDSMPASSKVEIMPNINYFNDNVYKTLE